MKTSIRFLRKKRHMTLTQLSRKTGITAAHLSMIERDKREPSLQALQKIADALEVDKEVFWWNSVIRDPASTANYRLIHKEERPIYHGTYNSGLVYEDITRNIPSTDNPDNIDLLGLVGKLAPGCNTNPYAPTQHPGKEFVYLLKGEMICEIECEKILMKEGDSLIIEAGMAHRFINASDEQVEVMMVRIEMTRAGASGKIT